MFRMRETVVLLHGFSGTARAWDRVLARLDSERYRPVALDLRGHGAAGDRRPVTFAACIEDVLGAAPPRFALAGYSMGGRIALALALDHPGRVDRLVLVSASPGIVDAADRSQRRRDDDWLAERLEGQGIEAFARDWESQPLFAGQPEEVVAEARADRLRNRVPGLAAALRGLGTGAMDPMWDRLGELSMPVVVVVGERDERFRDIGARMVAGVERGRLVVVAGAGHAVHLEAPAAVADAIG